MLVVHVDDRPCSLGRVGCAQTQMVMQIDRAGDHDQGADPTRECVIEGVANHGATVQRGQQLVRRAGEPACRPRQRGGPRPVARRQASQERVGELDVTSRQRSCDERVTPDLNIAV